MFAHLVATHFLLSSRQAVAGTQVGIEDPRSLKEELLFLRVEIAENCCRALEVAVDIPDDEHLNEQYSGMYKVPDDLSSNGETVSANFFNPRNYCFRLPIASYPTYVKTTDDSVILMRLPSGL